MAKPRLLIFILFFMVVVSSCKKNDWDGGDPITVVIEGFAKENQTGKPVFNAKIYVYIYTGKVGWGSSKEVVGLDRTNEKGEYQIEINTTKDQHLYVVFSDNKYIGVNEQTFVAKSSPYKKLDFNVDIPGYASIKFVNTTPGKNIELTTFASKDSKGSGGRYSKGTYLYRNDFFTFPSINDVQVYLKFEREGLITRDTISLNVTMRDTLYLAKHF